MPNASPVKQLENDHSVKQKAMLLVGWIYSGGQGDRTAFSLRGNGLDRGCATQAPDFFPQSVAGIFVVLRIDFVPDAMSPPAGSGKVSAAGSHKWVENSISDEAEHTDQPLSQFDGKRCRMVTGTCTCESGPDLLKPFPLILNRNETQDALSVGWLPVATRFFEHEDELNVVLDNGIRFIRLTEES